jgi:DtxR family Mn-dependent transcriptional regulator
MTKKLSPNMEMYLKTILRLGRDSESVRVKAIAESLGVTMPSVSEALRSLKAKGLVLHPSYGEVKLSAQGRRIAAGVNDRFEVLQRFLVDILKVDPHVAEVEACEIEHVVGKDTFLRLTAYLDYLTTCSRDLGELIDHFHEFLDRRLAGEPCPECEHSAKAEAERSNE